MLKNARRKVVYFFEVIFPYLIPIFFISLLTLNALNNRMSEFDLKYIEILKVYIYEDFYIKIRDKDGVLITVSAVFIGIYFTIFSILGNVRGDSALNVLKENHFQRLLNYIFLAFLSSFAYLFLSLFSTEESDPVLFKSTSLILLVYMFYAALRFGTIMFYSYRKDFKNFKKRMEQERAEELKYRNAILKIEKYIDKMNEEEQKNKNKNLL